MVLLKEIQRDDVREGVFTIALLQFVAHRTTHIRYGPAAVSLQYYSQKINSKITFNLLKFNILKDTKTIQKATLFVQKKAGIPWFKFSGKAFGFWMDPKISEIF